MKISAFLPFSMFIRRNDRRTGKAGLALFQGEAGAKNKGPGRGGKMQILSSHSTKSANRE